MRQHQGSGKSRDGSVTANYWIAVWLKSEDYTRQEYCTSTVAGKIIILIIIILKTVFILCEIAERSNIHDIFTHVVPFYTY